MLPWRGDQIEGYTPPPPPSPYGTWISEIMCQQTRIETVIPYWYRWMEKFPTVFHLANATSDDVNVLWAGLGYYRRAQQLLNGAKHVVRVHDGEIPSNLAHLLQIPGIGPYTAGAISSISFKKPEALVDGNVIRVLSRLRAITQPLNPSIEKKYWELSKSLVCRMTTDPGGFNQGLMELGATICKPTSPNCDACPLQTVCDAYHLVHHRESILANVKSNTESEDTTEGTGPGMVVDIEDLASLFPSSVTHFPLKVIKKDPVEVKFTVLVIRKIVDSIEKYIFIKRHAKGLLCNQWEFLSMNMDKELEDSCSSNKRQKKSHGDPDSREGESSTVDEVLWLDTGTDTVTGTVTVIGTPISRPPTVLASGSNLDVMEGIKNFLQSSLGVKMISKEDSHAFISPPQYLSAGLDAADQPSSPDSTVSPNTTLRVVKCHHILDPITHIFSHQRHVMTIAIFDVEDVEQEMQMQVPEDLALAKVGVAKVAEAGGGVSRSKEYRDREIRWLSFEDVQALGMTTAIKKIFHCVHNVASNGESVSEGISGKSSLAQKRKTKTIMANIQEDDEEDGEGEGEGEGEKAKKGRVDKRMDTKSVRAGKGVKVKVDVKLEEQKQKLSNVIAKEKTVEKDGAKRSAGAGAGAGAGAVPTRKKKAHTSVEKKEDESASEGNVIKHMFDTHMARKRNMNG